MSQMKSTVQSCFVSPTSTLEEVMRCIDASGKGIALVVDEQRRLLGTITDGDVRRAILARMKLTDLASALLSSHAHGAKVKPITACEGSRKETLLKLMEQHELQHLPIVSENGDVVDLVVISDLVVYSEKPLQALIMAGGAGRRMMPLTKDCPKPMLTVGDRPLMEHLIDHLRQAGIKRVNVATHFQEGKITDYFGDGKDFGVDIHYVSESEPLGTAGAIGLLETPQDPLLVLNGDIFTRIDFKAMRRFHVEHGADLTVGVRHHDFEIPYGVIEMDASLVREMREKPVLNLMVNAGIYLLEPRIHSLIPKAQKIDMNEVIEMLLAQKQRVVGFPIVEGWMDIGRPSDYERAQKWASRSRSL